tara:strand:- start:184 stop:360 length:177 start_codon:yes stop_codon:yes gene_type:complete
MHFMGPWGAGRGREKEITSELAGKRNIKIYFENKGLNTIPPNPQRGKGIPLRIIEVKL